MADEAVHNRTFKRFVKKDGVGSGFAGAKQAFLYKNNGLEPIEVVTRDGQRFEDYATAWEKKFSNLFWNGTCPAVVDENLQVVGHLTTSAANRSGSVWLPAFRGERGRIEEGKINITIDGREIAVDQNKGVQFTRNGKDGVRDVVVVLVLNDLVALINSGHPAFFDESPPDDQWGEWSPKFAPYVLPDSWLCTVDGQILGLISSHASAGAVAEENPWDYVSLAKAVVHLSSKGGMKLIKVLGAKVRTRTALTGASAGAADLAAAALAKKAVIRTFKGEMKSFIPESGMTKAHFEAFQAATTAEKDLIVLVRPTNPKSVPLIEKGCKGKPKNLEFLNTADDGIVTATKPTQVLEVYDRGYFVVGDDKVARRLVSGDVRKSTAVYESVDLKDAFWSVRKGQVLDAQMKKPIVGDYDLMGVIPIKSPGQNIALVGEDFTNPMVNRFRKTVNAKMGEERVLHGAQDNYGDFRGGAVAFFPDGTASLFKTEDAVRAFYKSLGRETRMGTYSAAAGEK